MKSAGYQKRLYMLPFDHRRSFQTRLFGWMGELNADQTAQIATAKQVIYEGFKAAIRLGAPEQIAGILTDEQFGAAMLLDARAHGYTTACAVEKSGRAEFDFEYGEDFAAHLEKFQPSFAKALLHYNPEGDHALNARQAARFNTFKTPASSRMSGRSKDSSGAAIAKPLWRRAARTGAGGLHRFGAWRGRAEGA